MLRLAVITNYFPVRQQSHRGQSAYQTLRILARQMKIQVFCPTAKYCSWLRPVKFSYIRPDISYSPNDLPVLYAEYPAVPGVSRPLNGILGARALLPHVRRFKPDLILNYTLYPEGFASTIVGKQLQVPVILGAIGSDLHSIPDQFTGFLTRRALRSASAVITVSDDLRLLAIQRGAVAERTKTVRNGVDASVFRVMDRTGARTSLGLDSRSPLLLFVGWLARHKGVNDLLDAFMTVLPRFPDLGLAYVGEGVLQRTLQEKVIRAGLANNILFPGPCPPERVAVWMAAANALCLPSYAEGCPNVILEALACGRPLVASAVGGIPEILNERCGILVPAGNTKRLATALTSVLTADWNSLAIAEHSQRSWQHVAAETFAICRSTLERHSVVN